MRAPLNTGRKVVDQPQVSGDENAQGQLADQLLVVGGRKVVDQDQDQDQD